MRKRQAVQSEFRFKSAHGGRRKGAGRPRGTGRQGHVAREKLNPRYPVHVTLKLSQGLPSLRKKEVFRCFREAVRKARKQGFAVTHFAILSNHVHLVLEPKEERLTKMLRSLSISFAKRLNQRLGRKGQVFHDRYHVHVLKTPTETRHALAYVLTNEAKHGKTNIIRIDPFSSAWAFDEWGKLLGERMEFMFSSWPEQTIESWHAEILSPARTWLLTQGWEKARPKS